MFPIALFAQTGTSGQIAGSVTDANGALVPDATITVTKVDTGEKRTVTTSADGNYTIANLPIGTYTLNVTKSGFKETSVSNIIVNVSNTTRQDVELQTGVVSDIVNITADNVQIETQTGAVSEVVTGEQVRELPLNGRSFTQLTQLQPGVSAANNFDSKQKGLFGGVDFSVNGNSGQSNLFLTDGANNNDTGSNRTILLFPSIEAIAEFKSLRNSYGPEYGQAAGAIVSIATRGGSNNFHGSLFYFGRNDALNATELITKNSGLKKDSLRRNDYGGSLGGPIIKDRLFFFYSQEWNKEIRGRSRSGSVPTLLERQGNFSQPRILPNGTRCSGPAIGGGRPGEATQIIPAANLSAAGLAMVKIFPLPNTSSTTSCNNYAAAANSPINFREENVRIDYTVNSKNKIFGRYTQDNWANPFPILQGSLWGDDAFPTIESSWTQPSRQAAVKLTTQLSGTAINDIQFSYSANRINVDPGSGADINVEINTKIPGLFPTSGKVNGNNRPHPVFWGGIAPFQSNSGPDLWTQSPFRNSLDIYTVRDDFTMVRGNHALKMGFLFDTAAKNEDSGPNNEATQFWGACCGNNSGNYLADILTTGSLFGFNESNTMAVGQNRYKNLEFYFGDTWKAKPNLTLELGARYSLLFEPTDKRNLISGFLPSAYNPARPATDPCNGLVVPKGTNPCAGIAGASTPTQFSNRSLRENNYKNLAPRLGVAWDVFSNGKTAIRGGFGLFYLRERTSIYFASLTQNAPFVISNGGQRTLDGSVYSGLGAASAGSPRFGLSPEAATPYSMQFNVSFGQQLWKETVLEVGYVGNRARKQLTHNDVNQVKEANRKAAAFAVDGNAVNALRPYSNYGTIYQFERNGRGDYDSLQVLFRTRFAKSFQLQAAYTYSRSLADFGLNDSSGGSSAFAVLDRNNRDLDFAESDINRPHIFVANMIYNLPGFKGSNGFVRTVLGGWEVASIVQLTSGTSLTPQLNATGLSASLIQTGTGVTNTQNFQAGVTGLGTGVANQRPLRVEGVPCTISNGSDRFLNPAAWTLVGYKIGETIPKKSTCTGPGYKNVDFSIYKNFSPSWLKNSFLGESARIQLRFEFFNAFNTVNYNGGSLPIVFYNGEVRCGANPCSATNNTITSAGAAGNFGQALTTKGAREIQYAFKLNF
ncbi:MAG: carboxypeptidase regulatory-like domain-containing protein [Acidobacteria bacterium]|nr:carboxypeptidase regulatory-like domain-containing protein [Acidobacteriota bacterium]